MVTYTLLLIAIITDWTAFVEVSRENTNLNANSMVGIDEEKTKPEISFTGRGYEAANQIRKCKELSDPTKQEACWQELINRCKAQGGKQENCEEIKKDPDYAIVRNEQSGCWKEKCQFDSRADGATEFKRTCCCMIDECKSDQKLYKSKKAFAQCKVMCNNINACKNKLGLSGKDCMEKVEMANQCFSKQCKFVEKQTSEEAQLESRRISCCAIDKCQPYQDLPHLMKQFAEWKASCDDIKDCLNRLQTSEEECVVELHNLNKCWAVKCNYVQKETKAEIVEEFKRICCCAKDSCQSKLIETYTKCGCGTEDISEGDDSRNLGYSLTASVWSISFCVAVFAASIVFQELFLLKY